MLIFYFKKKIKNTKLHMQEIAILGSSYALQLSFHFRPTRYPASAGFEPPPTLVYVYIGFEKYSAIQTQYSSGLDGMR